ncbi:MAG: tetratricopeptide repeat-containing protein [Pyrinomonadaceae bacterium]
MRAFIIRPFGKKKDLQGNEIDFNEVERVLIAPALEAVDAEGGTTIDIVESGNIRTDMFRRLLTADLVVADLSIHNANVFYELGIRHALREHGTFMLRSDGDAFPFDLQTDRYFVYKKENPAASLGALILALQRTKDAQERQATVKDSPVYTSLPKLREPDPTLFNILPEDFAEDVARAAATKQAGDLALFSYEIRGLEWEAIGWRAVGRAQFNLKAWAGAEETWGRLRTLEPNDPEANLRLGTIHEQLDDLVNSDQVLAHVRDNPAATPNERAEAYALLARNAKTCWRADWESRPPEERAAAALRSPLILDSFGNYERAFEEDLSHFYSGLNALAMLKVLLGLADALPDVWAEGFRTAAKAGDALDEYREQADKLAGAVALSLAASEARLKREGVEQDVWDKISVAEHCLLTTAEARPFVAAGYRSALAGAPDFTADSVRKQLAIYRDLGVLGANLAEVFKVYGEPPPLPEHAAAPAAAPPPRPRVLLFAGHMIDAPERKQPRFPADKEGLAREKLKHVIKKEMETGGGVRSGYAGGANGGDILFQEVCAELGIRTRLYLAMPPGEYVRRSVKNAGQTWVERFWRIHNEHAAQKQVREPLSEATDVPQGKEHLYLPAWLREKESYGIWQRNNLWMLFNALDEACDPESADPNITLIALWDGAAGDGPGGTGDLVDKVENLGARVVIIDTKDLLNP